MFIRVKKKSDDKFSVQLVESVRDKGLVRQKILRHLGVAHNKQEVETLKEVGRIIQAQIEDERQPKLFSPQEMTHMANRHKNDESKDGPLMVDLKKISEEARHITGIHDVYGKVFDELGFGTILNNPARKVFAQRVIKELVLARIACPSSKRNTVIQLEVDFGVNLNLDSVYNVLDLIDDKTIERLKEKNASVIRTIFDNKLDVIFFDCTTLYFESFSEDDLRRNGFSKDLKFNQPQVVLALMVTKGGLPIGYEVFPGNTYEGHTLVPAITKLKEKYSIDRIVFVADSALLSKDNLDFFKKNNFHYIIGARLKGQKKSLVQEILNHANYKKIQGDDDRKIAVFKPNNTDMLIVSHSKKRMRKDAYDREKAIESLRKKLKKIKSPKQYLSNYGYKKFLKIEGESDISLDESKIEESAKWDGLHGVISNIDWMCPHEILAQYKGLWQVEESFRISKHDLRIRPIFHWKDRRVKAHLAICFMAFCCVRFLEFRTRAQFKKLSPEVIRRELLHVQASLLYDHKNKKKYILPSKRSKTATKLYQIMDVPYQAVPHEV